MEKLLGEKVIADSRFVSSRLYRTGADVENYR